mmetsp:Transcript_41344/g.109533  ORF Transcript_41344/g.109533 Transcript_41344/m.109533 type:complete len:338 (-) Transcript_41344:198-1211(-)
MTFTSKNVSLAGVNVPAMTLECMYLGALGTQASTLCPYSYMTQELLQCMWAASGTGTLMGLPQGVADITVGMQEKLPFVPQSRTRRVSFADDLPGGIIAEVRQYTNFEQTHWTRKERELSEGCGRLLAQLDSDSEDVRRGALRPLAGFVRQLSLTDRGYEVIQRALEVARCGAEQEALTAELHTHVLELAASESGSEVLQSCLAFLPPARVQFIVSEIAGVSRYVAQHPSGHEVLCRILEFLSPVQAAPVVDALVTSDGVVAELCTNEYGQAVLASLLEYGSASTQERVCSLLVTAARASQPFVMQVIDHALLFPSRPGRTGLLAAFSTQKGASKDS